MPNDPLTLSEHLVYRFKDPKLLVTALTHPSSIQEMGSGEHNQRLEFLGDAVLALVLSHALFRQFLEVDEGPLTKGRANLVNKNTLAILAKRLRLGEHLLLSRGEEASGGRSRTSNLADAYEALLGAIFLDGGYHEAETFILSEFHDLVGKLEVIPCILNPKGELQEILQATSTSPPSYQLVRTSGLDHDPLFEIAVYHNGTELGRGKGKSKKDAESQAASNALNRLRTGQS